MPKNVTIDDYKEIESYLGFHNLYCGLWMAFLDECLFHNAPGVNIIDDIELDTLKVLDKSAVEMNFTGSGNLRVDHHYSFDEETAFSVTFPFTFQAHGQHHTKQLIFDELDIGCP